MAVLFFMDKKVLRCFLFIFYTKTKQWGDSASYSFIFNVFTIDCNGRYVAVV